VRRVVKGSILIRRLRRDVPLVIIDVAAGFAAYIIALVLRFDGAVGREYWEGFQRLAIFIVGLHIVANYLFGLYGQMWRYASVPEARRVLASGISSGLLLLAGALAYGRPRPIPLSVLVIGSALSVMGFGAIRFQNRLFAIRQRSAIGEKKRVLLVGAGDAGAMVLKDILRNVSLGLHPVGVVDDDKRKVGRVLHGVRIMGTRAAIPPLVQQLQVDQVLLAIPSATGELVREVAALCEEADVPLKVLPTVREIVGGRVTARDIRDLSIEDLLGREQVQTDTDAVAQLLKGRRVLVTGAGGSIGSELVRQIVSFSPETLVLLDHDETHLHDVITEVDGAAPVRAALADVRDPDRILGIFVRERPQVVFHAAAHKHVPLLEVYPEEALRTNVIGTANVVDAAVATEVERFVLISTDKAIRPTSVMGASKWLAEQMVRSVEVDDSIFCAVRFGNVVGSRGSVIPTFLRQIARGGPVTVTDPSMIRYFMSVGEAVQLVLQAAAFSKGGEVYTLEMGEPVSIHALARKLIRLSGRVPGRDIEISIVGPRPGEKLIEEVRNPEEGVLPSGHAGIAVSSPLVPDRAALKRAIWELESLAPLGETDQLADRIKKLASGALQPVALGDPR
jgi:FlaA1/EpsC-like NDP-sugar epimerase